MTNYKDKVTKGPWRVSRTTPLIFGAVRGPGMEPIGFVYAPAGDLDSEPVRRAASDCQLIAEAGTVLHETGMTPRELADQCRDKGEQIGYMQEDWQALCDVAGETGAHMDPEQVISEFKNLAEQREELLAALKVLVSNGGIGPESMFDDAKNAIAKCEGGT